MSVVELCWWDGEIVKHMEVKLEVFPRFIMKLSISY